MPRSSARTKMMLGLDGAAAASARVASAASSTTRTDVMAAFVMVGFPLRCPVRSAGGAAYQTDRNYGPSCGRCNRPRPHCPAEWTWAMDEQPAVPSDGRAGRRPIDLNVERPAYVGVSPSQVHSVTLLGGSGWTPNWR